MQVRLAVVGLIPLVVSGCGEFSGASGNGGYDPLLPPGGALGAAASQGGFAPGVFVETLSDGASFFFQRPQGSADANKLLAAGTPMKVIQSDTTYVKVELDSGEIGYVPLGMVAERAVSNGQNDPLVPDHTPASLAPLE